MIQRLRRTHPVEWVADTDTIDIEDGTVVEATTEPVQKQ
jgi:hypothetical protein